MSPIVSAYCSHSAYDLWSKKLGQCVCVRVCVCVWVGVGVCVLCVLCVLVCVLWVCMCVCVCVKSYTYLHTRHKRTTNLNYRALISVLFPFQHLVNAAMKPIATPCPNPILYTGGNSMLVAIQF